VRWFRVISGFETARAGRAFIRSVTHECFALRKALSRRFFARCAGAKAGMFCDHMTIKPLRPRAVKGTVELLLEKWGRDSDQPLSMRIDKAVDYLTGMLAAPWYLRKATIIGRGTRALAKPRVVNHGTLSIGRDTVLRSINTPVEIVVGPHGSLSIGDACQINYGVSIHAARQIRIGDRVHVGPYVMIIDEQFHDVHDRNARPPAQPISIANDVWIGAKASILPGITIGRGAVVAAHSLVNRNVEPFSIVAGVPARPIGQVDVERFVCEEEPIDPSQWRRADAPVYPKESLPKVVETGMFDDDK
jgi:maltose O-acetyltransferase